MSHDWFARMARAAEADAAERTARVLPLITHGPLGTVLLLHREFPGTRVYVRPCWRRRVGLVRSQAATRGEMRAWWAAWDTPA